MSLEILLRSKYQNSLAEQVQGRTTSHWVYTPMCKVRGDCLIFSVVTGSLSKNRFGSPVSPDGFRIASIVFHPADINEDTHRDFFDVSAFISLYREGDLRVDFDHDGGLDFADVEVFLSLF